MDEMQYIYSIKYSIGHTSKNLLQGYSSVWSINVLAPHTNYPVLSDQLRASERERRKEIKIHSPMGKQKISAVMIEKAFH